MKMEHYNQELFNSLINLDTFSRIMPNTDIHLSKTGYFVPTAGKLSSIIGAQTISNYFNNYTADQLALDVKFFSAKLVNLLYDMCHYANGHNDCYGDVYFKIRFIKKEFMIAYGNESKGLACLLKTYEGTPIYDSLFKSVHYILETLSLLKNISKKWVIDNNYTFNDQDWELYINNSSKLQYETTGFYKYYVQYNGSFMLNNVMNNIGVYNWFDKIYTVNGAVLYLGAMPLKVTFLSNVTRNDVTLLQELNINAVLSVVECYENQSDGIIYTPISPTEWKDAGIKYLQVPIPDFSTVDLCKINTCVEYIHWCISNGKNVYCHCRIGKSRSSLIVMAYLIKYQGFTTDDVYDYVRSIRPQVQNKHHKTLVMYEESLNNDF